MNKANFIILITGGLFFCGCATSTDMSVLNVKIQALTNALESVQANQAGLSLKMDELSRDITVSSENLKEMDAQMARLGSRMDDVSVLLQEKAKTAVLTPSQLFEEARANIDKENYDTALDGLNLYLTTYPKGEYAEAATVLKGDVYFAKKEYQNAAVAYATALKNYPKSKSTPAYRLKYANSILPLGKKEEAKNYLLSIAQDFPKSAQSSIATAAAAKIK